MYALAVTDADLKQIRKDTGLKKSELGRQQNCVAHVSTFEREKERLCIVVMNDTSGGYEVNLALLAHEAVHIWQNIKEAMHETNPSSEFEAYSIQNICLDLFKEYRCYIDGRDTATL